MKLLIAAGATQKFVYMKALSDAVSQLGVECKLVKESEYATGFPSKNILEWFSNKKFKKLISEFKPDAVFVDRQSHFGLESIKAGIPLFVYLRGHFWLEQEWAKKTIYKDPIMKTVINLRAKTAEECFRDCTAILPITKYLEGVVKEHYPNKPTDILSEGMDASLWYPQEGMNLKHPCVGLLQYSNWWGKTKEMMILPKVLEALPHVTFYWVGGGGAYQEKILSLLEKYDNFKFLGRLQYPDQVRQYLTEIDVYALVTGLDTLGVTILEASLMKKPVVATDAAAIPEVIKNGITGYTAKEGDAVDLVEKLTILLNDKKIASEMSIAGYEFVKNNFSWDKMATDLLSVINKHLNKVK